MGKEFFTICGDCWRGRAIENTALHRALSLHCWKGLDLLLPEGSKILIYDHAPRDQSDLHSDLHSSTSTCTPA